MGKCGGRELNYASDVDVIFVAEAVAPPGADAADETAALATASRLAAGMIGVCARSTPEGSIFPVDPNLRPEGRNGRWSAPSPATWPTTSGGRRPGSSRRC